MNQFGRNIPFKGRKEIINGIEKVLKERLEKIDYNDKIYNIFIHLVGGLGVGKTRICEEIPNILKDLNHKFVKNYIYIPISYIQNEPTDLDLDPIKGLCSRIIKIMNINENDPIEKGNNVLDCLLKTIVKKNQFNDKMIIYLCLDNYEELIHYFGNENGVNLIKQISYQLGSCMFNNNQPYFLFPILSGTISIHIPKFIYPIYEIHVDLLKIENIFEILNELSNDYKFIKDIIHQRGFIRIIQSIGGHCKSLEYLIEILYNYSFNSLSFDYSIIYQELINKLKNIYSFESIKDSTEIIKFYLLREPLYLYQKINKKLNIQELQDMGIIFITCFENNFIIDIPFIWFKLLFKYFKDEMIKECLNQMIYILEHQMSDRDFKRFNYYLLISKFYSKKSISINDLYRNSIYNKLIDIQSLKYIDLFYQKEYNSFKDLKDTICFNINENELTNIFFIGNKDKEPFFIFEQDNFNESKINIQNLYKNLKENIKNDFILCYITNTCISSNINNDHIIIISKDQFKDFYGSAFSSRFTFLLNKIQIKNSSKYELLEIPGFENKIDLILEKKNDLNLSNIKNLLNLNEKQLNELLDYIILE